ncbi:hypothetical protein [Paenibacillus sp. HB172176]|uniref:MGH1-like glycoside hydrolase domain-containing protein n=1 Tax=Paenibacillus sp. HB172176 TaxID=2493690 RepID=UPI00143B30F7|nr:hypothetical protein [Paenibacillus sp. HB172176]
MHSGLMEKLRSKSIKGTFGDASKPWEADVIAEWERSGASFSASGGKLEHVHEEAMRKLLECIVPSGGRPQPILQEGGVYLGCWLESTGTINAELLSRFAPTVAESTFEAFALHQRSDGLLPYKVTEHGGAYRQIQLVTPLARSVWNHYRLNGKNRAFLQMMYQAMARYDNWIAAHRDTRGTGCVEAFSTFDTGHDLSPRFWHAPDTPHLDDAAKCDPNSPILPFLAPDLTANIYCQRLYLAVIAEELGLNETHWRAKAEASLASLQRYCFDEEDFFFYDRDRHNRFVRVQSDVLLRVMACEVGDRELFDEMLKRYLLNTRKFFAKYGMTSLSMDDPRFDPSSAYNSWGGASNFLSLIRTPHAFEHHGRYVELTWVLQPILAAAANMTRFSQALSPWTGEEGFTETYSPAILCVLDFVERLSGILPTSEGELWFTGLRPYPMDHGAEVARETAYSRIVDGNAYEFINAEQESAIYRDGKEWLRFPGGIRIITDRSGELRGIIGMSVHPVAGTLRMGGVEIPFAVKGNEKLAYSQGGFISERDIGIVYPTY